jgi:hypothetical protein
MRKQYYTLHDMYRLKGGFLKNRATKLAVFEGQKAVFEKYTSVEDYEFLLQLPYFGTFTSMGGTPIAADDGLEQVIRDKIEEHFNKNTLECLTRIEYTKTQLPTFNPAKLLEVKNGAEERLKDVMYDAEQDVQSAQSRLAEKIGVMKDLCMELEVIEKNKSLEPDESGEEIGIRVNKTLASITRTGEWDFVASGTVGTDQDYVFVSKDIIMTSPKGVSVNFGKVKLLVKLHDSTPRLLILPFRDNISSEHVHPNISTYGSICWGNMDDKALTMLASLDISGAVDILNIILTKYTPTSPYRRFDAFVRDDNKGNRHTVCTDDFEGRKKMIYMLKNVNYNEPVIKYLFPKLVEPEESQSTNQEEANAN